MAASLPHRRFSIDRVDAALRQRAPRTIEGTAHAAAVALVLRERERGLEALFIRRAENPKDPWSGHVGLPGGRAEREDAGLVHTAIRETAEEIGLALAPERHLLGPLDETRATARSKAIDMKIAPFVFAASRPQDARDLTDALTLSEEVASTHWLPLVDVFDPARGAAVTMEHAGQTLRFPAISIDGLMIWGLTLRMLRNFETLVGGDPA